MTDRRRLAGGGKLLPAGRYAVHWIAVATDGHRTQGNFAFIVK